MLISASLARCAPGGRAPFMELARESIELFERHGAGATRLFEPLVAGEASDLYALASEFAGADAHGEFIDSLYGDPAYDSFTARTAGLDSPLTVVYRILGGEVPLDTPGRSDRGEILTAYLRRPHAGRFEDCCDILRALFVFLEEHGGSNCRLYHLDAAGSRTGELLACWECDSMGARGQVLDAFGSSPAGHDLAQRMGSADAPMSVAWAGLYRVVHP